MISSMLTLYDCTNAPNPRRARIFLAEKGIRYDKVMVDLRNGENFSDAFRKINPDLTVPVLRIDDSTSLTDNAAIIAYLEAVYPEPPLLGKSPLAKAEIASWHWKAEHDGLLAVTDALRNSSPAMVDRAVAGPVNYSQIPALAERGLARVQRFFAALDAHLADKKFVAAGEFSLADITAVVSVDFARIVKVKPGDEHPHLKRWRESMEARGTMS